MMENRENEIDVAQLVRTIWRAKWWIAVAMITCAFAAYLYSKEIAKPVFVSSATVAIESSQPQVTDLDALVGGLSAEQPSLNTQIHLIESRQLLRRLVIEQGLINDPEFNPQLAETSPYSVAAIRDLIFGPEEPVVYTDEELIRIAVDRLRNRLTVTNPRQSFVFQIAVEADSRQKATDLANAVAQTYINDQLLFKEEQSDVAIAFLDLRTRELQAELNEGELEVKDFAASIELISPETLVAKNRQVKELRERLLTLEAVMASQQLNVEMYQGLTPDTASMSDFTVLNNVRLQRLFADVSEGRQDQSRLEAALEQERSRAEAELAQTEAQRRSLAAAVVDLEQEVEDESRDLLTLQQLQREADAIGEIYGYFLARLKEAEVQQGTQQPDARLLSAAVLPRQASSPRVLLNVLVGAIIGAMIAASVALLREFSTGGFRTAAHIQTLTNQAVLGQIPMGPFRRRKKLVPFLKGKSNTAFSEAIRNLRTSLLLADPNKEPRVILLTSSIPGEGKTTTSISLAQSLVGMGRSVLLVEGDVRKNTLGEYFEDENIPDIVDLIGEKDAVTEKRFTVDGLGFDLVFGARQKVNAADFFSSDEFKTFIENVRAHYDHIVIDAPPILPVTDARIIGQQVDAVLYAIAWDATRTQVVQAGLAELANVDLGVTGLVLTKIDAKKARSYGGSARYGNYYGEYSAGYYK